MRWDESHQSPNVEDRRGQAPARRGGGAGLLFWLFTRFGWPGLLIGGVALAVMYYGQGSPKQAQDAPRPAEENRLLRFVGFVFDDAQSHWQANARGYRPARLVAFTGATETGCGYGSAAVGPFYCPLDEKVYIDLSFYRALRERMGAPGDFAQAYVIAHEVGHHLQKLSGRLETRGRSSVATELQADCFAGAWARSAQKRALLEVGDIDEAMGAAAAVGDDTLQRQRSGQVRPETFTHGSAAQRQAAFTRGLEGGASACTTER
jgi:predicted metalloprotease